MSRPLKIGIACALLSMATNPLYEHEFLTRLVGVVGFVLMLEHLYEKEQP